MFQRLHIQEGSSLICNTSDRHERHECDTNATRVLHERLECDMSAAKTTRVRHERKILVLIVTRVKTYFYTPIFTIWLMKDYKKRNSFILRTAFLHMFCIHVEMHLKSVPQKVDFLITKAISKSCTLDCSCKCPCTFLNSYTQ